MNSVENIEERIKYLDGIKGVAAIIVLFGHLVHSFYPVLFSDSQNVLNQQNVFVEVIASSPLNIIYAGTFAVMLFFLISGYVLGHNYFMRRKNDYIASSVFRRYFRLMIPAFLSCFIAYLLLKFNCFFNLEVSPIVGSSFLNIPYNFEADFFKMIKFAVYDQFFQFQFNFATGYNNVLWIMKAELFGSLLVLSVLAIFGHTKRRLLIYNILIFLLYKTLYLPFLLGLTLCELKLTGSKLIDVESKILLLIIFIAGLYFSSFRSYNLRIYNILYMPAISQYIGTGAQFFYNTIGAFLLLVVFFNSTYWQNFFANSVNCFLGKISFSIYLLHMIIICSISCYFYKIIRPELSYELSFLITSIFTIIITLFTSNLFYVYLEKKSAQWPNKLYKYFFE